MSFTKVYIGEDKPLAIYMNVDINGFTFTVTNSDDTAYDFTGLTDLNLKIYDHRGGTLEATIVNGATGVAAAANVITWNSDYSVDILITKLGIHYYDLIWEDSNSKPILIAFGDLKII